LERLDLHVLHSNETHCICAAPWPCEQAESAAEIRALAEVVEAADRHDCSMHWHTKCPMQKALRRYHEGQT